MVFQNDILAGAAGAGGGYTINQSIRFNDDDSAYLTDTLGTATDTDVYTISLWVKRGNLGLLNYIFSAGPVSTITEDFIGFQSNDTIFVRWAGTTRLATTQVFRDSSAWYHVILACDYGASGSDKAKLYINGAEVTAFGTDTRSSITGTNQRWNTATLHYFGRNAPAGGQYFDGYMAEINFIDGQQLAPTDFGETNDDGVWVPKRYVGTYGNNGFYLKGQDSAALGDDSSGNGNDFLSSGLTSDDQRADTPTNNMMTFNPLNNMRDDGDPTDGNRVFYNTGGTRNIGGTTFHFNTGKYVQAFSFDATGTSDWQIGSQPSDRADVNDAPGSNEDLGEAPVITPFGTYYVGVGLVGTSDTGITADTADTIWVAMDLDSGKQWIGLYDDSAASMIWFDSSAGQTGDPAAGSNPVYTGTANRSYNFALCSRNSTKITLLEESEATGTVPTGFTYVGAVQDTYATPTIADGSAYFQTTLYTGTGSTNLEVNQSENSTFQPDLVWIKQRNKVDNHVLTDAVRGAPAALYSNNTQAEVAGTGGITSLDPDGFTLSGDGSVWNNVNQSGITAAAWQWLAANGTASNTDGTITSTVSANTTAGFSIVTYTGGGGTGTVGHGLGQAPNFLIVKSRDTVNAWYTGSDFYTTWEYYQTLNGTAAQAAGSTVWNSTAPTSSVFSVGASVNTSAEDYVAYAFAEVEGFSKIGKYTGNGSAAGPFVWCGFRPALIIGKSATAAENWWMYDTARNTYNVADDYLSPNLTNTEATAAWFDINSNGFKVRDNGNAPNGSGATIIFMAFAEHPFGGDGVAPVPAR
jgi:hypothetical protein